ncbi:MAG: 4Fe-4S binding protein [Phascolarctobacterium sp.]|nr:4Fe-4S binding protein [Phascolarctobacterium sp.]
MNLEIKRFLTQLCASILYNINFFTKKPISLRSYCVPGLNCQWCPGAATGCPLGRLQLLFNGGLSKAKFVALASILLPSLLLGRIICGWLCPFGLLQDLLYKIPSPKIGKSVWTARLSCLKYVLAVFFILLLPLFIIFTNGNLDPAFCSDFCPNGLLNALIMISQGNPFGYALINDFRILLGVVLLITAIFIYRPFCRFICPLGAWYSLFSKLSIFAIKVDESKCISCNKCIRHCLMDCQKVGDAECIGCGKCKGICPTKAISYGIRYKK